MKLELYQRVALVDDLPEHGLKKGDVATLVDYVSHPAQGREGCILEVFNAIGESIAVVTAPVTAIGPLRANEIIAVRAID